MYNFKLGIRTDKILCQEYCSCQSGSDASSLYLVQSGNCFHSCTIMPLIILWNDLQQSGHLGLTQLSLQKLIWLFRFYCMIQHVFYVYGVQQNTGHLEAYTGQLSSHQYAIYSLACMNNIFMFIFYLFIVIRYSFYPIFNNDEVKWCMWKPNTKLNCNPCLFKIDRYKLA